MLRRQWLVGSSLALAFLLVLYGSKVSQKFSLADHGAQVQADVVDSFTESGKSTAYKIKVSFMTATGSVSDTKPVEPSTFSALSAGSKILITYDRTDPLNWSVGTFTPENAREYAQNWGLGWLGCCLLVAIGFRAFRTTADKQSEQLRNWPLAMFRVTSVSQVNAKSSSLKVEGTLQTEGGGDRKADFTLDHSIRTDEPLPVLVDPGSNDVVALESIQYAELDL